VVIDTRCHLDLRDFDPDRGEVIAAARAAGVDAIVVPAIEAKNWPGLLDLCASEPSLYPALGLRLVFFEVMVQK
jgi:TatD DNase family protein